MVDNQLILVVNRTFKKEFNILMLEGDTFVHKKHIAGTFLNYITDDSLLPVYVHSQRVLMYINV